MNIAESGMAAFQDALGDYYDGGAIGDPPRRDDFLAPETVPASPYRKPAASEGHKP